MNDKEQFKENITDCLMCCHYKYSETLQTLVCDIGGCDNMECYTETILESSEQNSEG